MSFAVGYLPRIGFVLWENIAVAAGGGGGPAYWFHVVNLACVRISEFLNPIMYNLGSRNLRARTKKLFYAFVGVVCFCTGGGGGGQKKENRRDCVETLPEK